jgi:tRNA A-37 threonylcarbamoyl transferase component Bud32
MEITREDWQTEFPRLLQRIESDQLEVIKRSRSGDVLEGEIILGGKPISVIIKRPRRKYWYRYLNSVGRPSRAKRIWLKAWKLYIRNVVCEFPLLVMEKQVLGYVTDSIIVLEKMQGTPLDRLDLDSLGANDREMMFRRLGRTLRNLERLGFTHFDAKSTNWIIRLDPARGPVPILIDVDGVRHYVWTGFGIDRLLRSMREHPQYTVADSLALCLGYAPFGKVVRDNVGSGSGVAGSESEVDKS